MFGQCLAVFGSVWQCLAVFSPKGRDPGFLTIVRGRKEKGWEREEKRDSKGSKLSSFLMYRWMGDYVFRMN